MPTQYLLLDSDRTVTLDGVEFTGGGIAVDIRRGRPVLKNVRIQSSGYSAIAISGTAAPSVSDCLIAGSHTSGVVVEGHARPEFHACRFSDNTPFHIQNSAVYEVNAEGNDWEPEASPSTILGDVRY